MFLCAVNTMNALDMLIIYQAQLNHSPTISIPIKIYKKRPSAAPHANIRPAPIILSHMSFLTTSSQARES